MVAHVSFTQYAMLTFDRGSYYLLCSLLYYRRWLCRAAQQCPLGYNQTSGRCLHVANTQLRWLDAQNYCRYNGGRLASVISDTDPVITVVSQLAGVSRVWIGLQKMRTDWHYATGIELN